MVTYNVGFIGCGGRGFQHATGFQASHDVDLVACADPSEEARQSFIQEFEIPHAYTDYRDMLAGEDLDIVSVCTWTGQHAEQIIATAESGVQAIHAEKPMATTWGDAKALYQACVDNDVMITFCHQRRFEHPFVKAKALLEEGAVGDLIRVEGACPNLFDWGTHWFDMFFFYNDDQPAEWVMGQIDATEPREVFGVKMESSGLSWIRWQNGLEGLLTTGGVALQGPRNRLLGSEGIIEIGGRDEPLRLWTEGGWEEPELDLGVPAGQATVAATLDLIDALTNDREPQLAGRKALQSTELIFATYESSRRRAKVVLPLDVEDSALLSMLDEGVIGPVK
jgi:predicted dehydrogenase